MARGSWKKLCAPGCHSELSIWVMGGGCGNRGHDLGVGGIAHRRQFRAPRRYSGCGPPPSRPTAKPRQRAVAEILNRDLRMRQSYCARRCWLAGAEMGRWRAQCRAPVTMRGDHAEGSRVLDHDGVADAAFAHGAAHGGQFHAGRIERHGDGLALGDHDRAAHIVGAERLRRRAARGALPCLRLRPCLVTARRPSGRCAGNVA